MPVGKGKLSAVESAPVVKTGQNGMHCLPCWGSLYITLGVLGVTCIWPDQLLLLVGAKLPGMCTCVLYLPQPTGLVETAAYLHELVLAVQCIPDMMLRGVRPNGRGKCGSGTTASHARFPSAQIRLATSELVPKPLASLDSPSQHPSSAASMHGFMADKG
jgi:hypothetical protein